MPDLCRVPDLDRILCHDLDSQPQNWHPQSLPAPNPCLDHDLGPVAQSLPAPALCLGHDLGPVAQNLLAPTLCLGHDLGPVAQKNLPAPTLCLGHDLGPVAVGQTKMRHCDSPGPHAQLVVALAGCGAPLLRY